MSASPVSDDAPPRRESLWQGRPRPDLRKARRGTEHQWLERCVTLLAPAADPPNSYTPRSPVVRIAEPSQIVTAGDRRPRPYFSGPAGIALPVGRPPSIRRLTRQETALATRTYNKYELHVAADMTKLRAALAELGQGMTADELAGVLQHSKGEEISPLVLEDFLEFLQQRKAQHCDVESRSGGQSAADTFVSLAGMESAMLTTETIDDVLRHFELPGQSSEHLSGTATGRVSFREEVPEELDFESFCQMFLGDEEDNDDAVANDTSHTHAASPGASGSLEPPGGQLVERVRRMTLAMGLGREETEAFFQLHRHPTTHTVGFDAGEQVGADGASLQSDEELEMLYVNEVALMAIDRRIDALQRRQARLGFTAKGPEGTSWARRGAPTPSQPGQPVDKGFIPVIQSTILRRPIAARRLNRHVSLLTACRGLSAAKLRQCAALAGLKLPRHLQRVVCSKMASRSLATNPVPNDKAVAPAEPTETSVPSAAAPPHRDAAGGGSGTPGVAALSSAATPTATPSTPSPPSAVCSTADARRPSVLIPPPPPCAAVRSRFRGAAFACGDAQQRQDVQVGASLQLNLCHGYGQS
eukprot:EG_transcript_7658